MTVPPKTRDLHAEALATEVSALANELQALRERNAKLQSLLDVARELGARHEVNALLDSILVAAKRVTGSDRCSLFLVDHDTGMLWSKIAHGIGRGTIRVPLGQGIVGECAATAKPVVIHDAYADERFNPAIDQASGYRTRNILAVPMVDDADEVCGVIQALNKASDRPYSREDEELLLALGGVAAVALQNAFLHRDIANLFEGFVRASVYAIEARDPTTSGHSERVARLTVRVAEAVNLNPPPAYRDVHFSLNELRELRFAALLHDFGKVGVHENVLVKANKLHPEQLSVLEARFETARLGCLHHYDQRRIEVLEPAGLSEGARAAIAEIAEEQQIAFTELESFWEFVLRCNKPTVLEEGGFGRLEQFARIHYRTADGRGLPLLTADEVSSLSIPKGTLSPEERRQIESHVTHTYRFLNQIPWTRDLARVPEIAHKHHDKLNGYGYPQHLPPAEIPPQARIMMITDIYDALTARDRPYKSAVPHERALDILGFEAKDGAIDRELLDLFIESRAHEVLDEAE